jgi:hypothetical protein
MLQGVLRPAVDTWPGLPSCVACIVESGGTAALAELNIEHIRTGLTPIARRRPTLTVIAGGKGA